MTLSLLLFSSCIPAIPEAEAAPEFSEGQWSIVSREAGNEWVYAGILTSQTGGTSSGVAPNLPSTEKYCVPANLRWPQVISTSPAKQADWLVLPLSDTEVAGTIDCTPGKPIKLDNPTVRTYNTAPCSTTGGSPACPAATGTGQASASANPIVSLKPGVYHVTAHRDAQGTRSTGQADVFIRPTATNGVVIETWCYDANFLWPKSSQVVGSVTYDRTWWEMGVDGSGVAPITVTCSAPKSNRVDYTYQ